MNLIDFHCDTLSECYNRKSELYKNDLHIDLERGKRVFNKYCQVFAVWIPDEKRGDEEHGKRYQGEQENRLWIFAAGKRCKKIAEQCK